MNKVVFYAEFGGFGYIGNAAARWAIDNELKSALNLEFEYADEWEVESEGWWCLCSEVDRHDPALVKLVEECPSISPAYKIATIEGDQYMIREYDGSERVVEPKDIRWKTIQRPLPKPFEVGEVVQFKCYENVPPRSIEKGVVTEVLYAAGKTEEGIGRGPQDRLRIEWLESPYSRGAGWIYTTWVHKRWETIGIPKVEVRDGRVLR